MPSSKELADYIYTSSNMERINSDLTRYEIYNGKLRGSIEKAIRNEFILQDTVKELINRVIPINITQKIINKLGAVYLSQPLREPANLDEIDQASINTLEQTMELNTRMKFLNRMFKLAKMAAAEPYLNDKGMPSLRVLPSHTFTPYSDSFLEPETPTHMIKHMLFTGDREKDRHIVWSATEHYTMNGEGLIIPNAQNPDNINPYGAIPLVYIKDGFDKLIPLQDDDLISMQIAICLLLTDLAFATKYQAWSLIYLIGAKSEKLSFNPNSVISLDFLPDGSEPKIGSIKPTVDIDAMLREVEALVGLLLSTKNLSVGSVSLKLDGTSAASGVSKILDQAESTEDKQDQLQYFGDFEKQLFDVLAKNIIPYWDSQNLINPKVRLEFSPDFELSISYPDQKPAISEKEIVEIEKAKVDAAFTSQRAAIQAVNPELDSDQIDALIEEIAQDKIREMEMMTSLPSMNPAMVQSQQEEDQEDAMEEGSTDQSSGNT